MIPKRVIAAAAIAAASLVSAGVTQPAFAAAGGPKITVGAPHAQAASTAAGPGGAATSSIWKVEATVNPQGMAPNPTNSTLNSVSATGPGRRGRPVPSQTRRPSTTRWPSTGLVVPGPGCPSRSLPGSRPC